MFYSKMRVGLYRMVTVGLTIRQAFRIRRIIVSPNSLLRTNKRTSLKLAFLSKHLTPQHNKARQDISATLDYVSRHHSSPGEALSLDSENLDSCPGHTTASLGDFAQDT